DAQEPLRGRARDDELAEIEIRGERSRIVPAQTPIQLERRFGEPGLQPVRQGRLEKVSRVQGVDDAAHRVAVTGPRKRGLNPGGKRVERRSRSHRRTVRRRTRRRGWCAALPGKQRADRSLTLRGTTRAVSAGLR